MLPRAVVSSSSSEKPLGLRPAQTEHLDAAQLASLTLDEAPADAPPEAEAEEAKAEEDDAPSPAVRVPLGIGVAKTEYLDAAELQSLKIDED